MNSRNGFEEEKDFGYAGSRPAPDRSKWDLHANEVALSRKKRKIMGYLNEMYEGLEEKDGKREYGFTAAEVLGFVNEKKKDMEERDKKMFKNLDKQILFSDLEHLYSVGKTEKTFRMQKSYFRPKSAL